MAVRKLQRIQNGFLSPTVEFYPCEWHHHMEVADHILEQYGDSGVYDPESKLLKNGWVEIHESESCPSNYVVGWSAFGHLSPEQVAVLKPLAETTPAYIENISELQKEFEC